MFAANGSGALTVVGVVLSLFVPLAVIVAFGATVGYFIGKSQGQARTGLWLGCLGPLGWLVIFLFVRPSAEVEAHRLTKIAAYRQAIRVPAGTPIAPYSVNAQRTLTQAALLPPPPVAVSAGWYPDPHRRFELRYFDGGTWTCQVASGGRQLVDP